MRPVLPIALLSCAAMSSQAALAPNYQRLAELKAILNEPAVVSAFDVYHPIDRIEFVRSDLYRVTAGSCHVDVTLANSPSKPNMVGPRQFSISVGKKICS